AEFQSHKNASGCSRSGRIPKVSSIDLEFVGCDETLTGGTCLHFHWHRYYCFFEIAETFLLRLAVVDNKADLYRGVAFAELNACLDRESRIADNLIRRAAGPDNHRRRRKGVELVAHRQLEIQRHRHVTRLYGLLR